ncbi:RagB/SusD family nutrient uptake outer membrane protein [Membranihabitans maritimus]|uniref:RagB/SusD family nutrient uptake outer membrane protein n=1 Tax=Membranihabitans maritimus TaxID=2904244 RepID=UPI001F38607C|nr:RagB/SusD family nutrient uptake outer membrane protein [Membranihabitans maritimus]
MNSNRRINKYLKIGITIICTSLGFSCENFLTKDPANVIGSSEFFQNQQQVDQGVVSIYASLQNVYDNHWKFAEQRSDNTTVQFWPANRGPHPIWLMEEFTMDASNQNIAPYWNDTYVGIQRANTVLNHIDNVEFSNEEYKNQLKGESQFLRAFFYFHLVRLFGEVPLVLNQVESPAEAFAAIEKRHSVEEVYNQIDMDIDAAISNLPSGYTGGNIGRATQGAARALKADILMTQGEFAAAKQELDELHQLNYELLPNYEEVFDPGSKNNAEIIFDVNYSSIESNPGLGSTFIYNFAPWNSGSQITGHNASTQGLNIPSIEIYNAYSDDDLRKDVSIGHFVDPSNVGQGIAMGDTILYIKKYDHTHAVQGRTNDNCPVYRYAHILLMSAECINEIEGPTTESYDAINAVRMRAGIEPLVSGLSQEQFREAVYREMQLELAFENHRWFNLLRTGKALETMERHGEIYRGRQPHFASPAYVIEEHKFLYPIPQREITLNPNLTQNPGW